jgi:hypothetical protein
VERLPTHEDVVWVLTFQDLFKFRLQVFCRCDPCIRSLNAPLLGISLVLDPVTEAGADEFLKCPLTFALGCGQLVAAD